MNKAQREEQRKENEIVKSFYEEFEKKYRGKYLLAKSNQLRSCQAYVYHFENFEILKSYNTVIAIYDRANNKTYDFLRYVYGFTMTSAHQISKFISDYVLGNGAQHFTYRNV